jgi:hypothetical protein
VFYLLVFLHGSHKLAWAHERSAFLEVAGRPAEGYIHILMKFFRTTPFLIALLYLSAGTACRDRTYDYIRSGNAKHARVDQAGAVTDYNRAIELKPHDPRAYYNR